MSRFLCSVAAPSPKAAELHTQALGTAVFDRNFVARRDEVTDKDSIAGAVSM